MIAPSPAPIPPKRRRWPWVAAGMVVLLVGSGAVLGSYPHWAGPRVHEEIVQRATDRLGAKVDVDSLELGYDEVVLRGVHVAEPDARIDLEKVTVALDSARIWEARFEVVSVSVNGGQVMGERDALEALARRAFDRGGAQGGDSGETSWLRKRVKLRPPTIEVVSIDADLSDGEQRHVTTAVDVTVDLETEAVNVDLAGTNIELDGREFRAASISTSPKRDGEGLEFPLAVEIRGGSTALTPQIAIASVSGSIEVMDSKASGLTIDLEGGFSDRSQADPEGAPTEVDGAAPGGELWSVAGSLRRDMSQGKLLVEMDSFELGRVPQVLAVLPVVDSEEATVAGRVELDFGDGRAKVDGRVVLEDLNVSHKLLAHEVVRGLGVDMEISATLDPAARSVEIERLEVRRKGVSLQVRGSVVHPAAREQRKYDLVFTVPAVPCQSVLDAIPQELVPALGGFTLEGDFDAQVTANIDFSDLDALELGGSIGMWKCKVIEVPGRLSANRLNGGFTHRVRMKDGRQRAVHLRPGSGSFTPLASISPNMLAGVQTTEDGSFFRHRGFLPSQFEEALRRNLKAGRVRLGASTITMQMVKNVFLSHERTLSRKLQEMFLTWHIEQTISKNRIMEIYLNVVEFGPGLYGVTNGARHYFGRHPSDLTSLEAAYLATMLPSPVRRHDNYCRQALTPRHEVKLRRIHGLMRSRGRITEEEYVLWKDLELIFDPTDLRSESECLAEGAALRGAKGGQIALSGMLANRIVDARPSLPSEDAPEDGPSELTPLPDIDAGDILPPEGEDPSMSDAPGVPAMDQDPGI